ncbi:MAG: RNA 2',3'-cyclic phosphodiesterase [Prolixibacteraceae bacterium]|nr:RNA 2',3'-cyclic phosphodiesterase [Prolixibacteraceae bacterium]
MKRIFIAIKIEPSEELLGAMFVFREQLSEEKINWVPIENLHITLLFIGSVDEIDVQEIKFELHKLKSIEPFSFTIEGLEVFKKRGEPKVLFAKAIQEKMLQSLSLSIRQLLSEHIKGVENIKFSPHLTLGRIKNIKNTDGFENLLYDFRNTYFQKVVCTGFVLYESILTPGGPIYTPLEIFSL